VSYLLLQLWSFHVLQRDRYHADVLWQCWNSLNTLTYLMPPCVLSSRLLLSTF
jgi:hypothetical protein